MSTVFAPLASATLPAVSPDAAPSTPAAGSVQRATPTSVLRITDAVARAPRQGQPAGPDAFWRCPQRLFGAAAIALALATLFASGNPEQPLARIVALVGLGFVGRSYQVRWVCRDRAQ